MSETRLVSVAVEFKDIFFSDLPGCTADLVEHKIDFVVLCEYCPVYINLVLQMNIEIN